MSDSPNCVIVLRPMGAAAEPAVFVAAWLLADLDIDGLAVVSGDDHVSLRAPVSAMAPLADGAEHLLRQRRFDGWAVVEQSVPSSP